MRIVTATQARASLKAVLDQVSTDTDVTLITRRNGSDVVLMSLAHYQRLQETLHLLSSPANALHLAQSIAQHKAGMAVQRQLDHS